MGAFEFVALDEQGRQRKGMREADTARQIRQQLRDARWTPLEVHEIAQREGGSGKGGLSGCGVSVPPISPC